LCQERNLDYTVKLHVHDVLSTTVSFSHTTEASTTLKCLTAYYISWIWAHTVSLSGPIRARCGHINRSLWLNTLHWNRCKLPGTNIQGRI